MKLIKEGFKGIACIEMMNICDFGQSNYWLSACTIKEDSKVKPLDIMLALEAENIESTTRMETNAFTTIF